MKPLAALLLFAPSLAFADTPTLSPAADDGAPRLATRAENCSPDGATETAGKHVRIEKRDVAILHECAGFPGSARLVIHAEDHWFTASLGGITDGSHMSSIPWRMSLASEGITRGTLADGTAAVVAHVVVVTVETDHGRVLSRDFRGKGVVCTLEDEPRCTSIVDLCTTQTCAPTLARGVLRAGKTRIDIR